jgi:hypothetical protein
MAGEDSEKDPMIYGPVHKHSHVQIRSPTYTHTYALSNTCTRKYVHIHTHAHSVNHTRKHTQPRWRQAYGRRAGARKGLHRTHSGPSKRAHSFSPIPFIVLFVFPNFGFGFCYSLLPYFLLYQCLLYFSGQGHAGDGRQVAFQVSG